MRSIPLSFLKVVLVALLIASACTASAVPIHFPPATVAAVPIHFPPASTSAVPIHFPPATVAAV